MKKKCDLAQVLAVSLIYESSKQERKSERLRSEARFWVQLLIRVIKSMAMEVRKKCICKR